MPSQQVCPQCKRTRWIPRYTAPWCTPSCKRAASREAERALITATFATALAAPVACCICGHLHSAASTGVLYRSGDRRWWCRNELACRRRERQHQAEVAAMYWALEDVWSALEVNGWRI